MTTYKRTQTFRLDCDGEKVHDPNGDLVAVRPIDFDGLVVDLDHFDDLEKAILEVEEILGQPFLVYETDGTHKGAHIWYRNPTPITGTKWRGVHGRGEVITRSWCIVWCGVEHLEAANRLNPNENPVDLSRIVPRRPAASRPCPGTPAVKAGRQGTKDGWRATDQRNVTLLAMTRSYLGKPFHQGSGMAKALAYASNLNTQFEKGPLSERELRRTVSQALKYRDRDKASGEIDRRHKLTQSERGRMGASASAKAKLKCPQRRYWVGRCRSLRRQGLSIRRISARTPFSTTTTWRVVQGCSIRPIPSPVLSCSRSHIRDTDRNSYRFRSYLVSREARRVLRGLCRGSPPEVRWHVDRFREGIVLPKAA